MRLSERHGVRDLTQSRTSLNARTSAAQATAHRSQLYTKKEAVPQLPVVTELDCSRLCVMCAERDSVLLLATLTLRRIWMVSHSPCCTEATRPQNKSQNVGEQQPKHTTDTRYCIGGLYPLSSQFTVFRGALLGVGRHGSAPPAARSPSSREMAMQLEPGSSEAVRMSESRNPEAQSTSPPARRLCNHSHRPLLWSLDRGVWSCGGRPGAFGTTDGVCRPIASHCCAIAWAASRICSPCRTWRGVPVCTLFAPRCADADALAMRRCPIRVLNHVGHDQ